jgi:signal transduction histidine kinase/ActR/RegA family two-component response regulator
VELSRFFGLILITTCYASLQGQPAAREPVQNIAGIRAAALKANQLGRVVRIRAAVTHPPGQLPGSARFFYVQDATGGISVVPPSRISLEEWEVLEVRGRIQLYNDLEPELHALEIVRTGAREPLQPVTLSIEDALRGSAAGSLVTVSGEVLHASISEDWAIVLIGTPGRRIRLQLRSFDNVIERFEKLAAPGAQVRGRGILVPVADGTFQVRMRTVGDLTQIRPAPLRISEAAFWAGGLALLAALLATLWIVTLRRSIRAKTAEIEDLLQKAQEASRLKSEFLANVSHEIRTPMHGILGLQELVLSSKLEPEARQQLEVAHSTTISLLTLLNDLLDFSRIEANRLALNPEDLDPRAVLRDAVNSLKVTADEKGLELRWSVGDGVPQGILCDRSRLRQVLLNLLSNAVKFTQQGEVEASMRLEKLEGAEATLRVSVCDTGPGIPPEQLAAVFEPFRQADGSVTRRYGGSGLGLSIASRLVELLGGRLWVESEVGKGSCFHVRIRCKVTQPAAGAGAPVLLAGSVERASRQLRILVAEDNRVNQLVARKLLEKAGHEVTVCENGKEAVELARQGGFDVILMDIQMPDMDGLEATRVIRSQENGSAKKVPIIALTAHSLQQDMERCLAAGMDGYVSKPFRLEALCEALERVVRKDASDELPDRLQ